MQWTQVSRQRELNEPWKVADRAMNNFDRSASGPNSSRPSAEREAHTSQAAGLERRPLPSLRR